MAIIEPECHLWGDTFSPSHLRQLVPAIQMRLLTEPGEIQAKGKYRGQPAPYGACCVTTPEEIEVRHRIEWMADYIAANLPFFKAAGATDIIYWLYWTGLQGNMEFKPSEIRKIANLDIPLCINYIQEAEDQGG
ncbi:MAG: hypothetical protein AB7R40_00680 [Nitrospiraceae bacterium]